MKDDDGRVPAAPGSRKPNPSVSAACAASIPSRGPVSYAPIYPAPPVDKLADAMCQLLQDMHVSGGAACGAAQAQARVAYEAFRDEPEDEIGIMPFSAAAAIIAEIERADNRSRTHETDEGVVAITDHLDYLEQAVEHAVREDRVVGAERIRADMLYALRRVREMAADAASGIDVR